MVLVLVVEADKQYLLLMLMDAHFCHDTGMLQCTLNLFLQCAASFQECTNTEF